MMRATTTDLPEVLTFLNAHADRAMFPLANLDRYGLDGDEPRGTSCWIRRGDDGKITDVLAVTNDGTVMPVCPTGPLVEPLADRQINAIIGVAEQCRPLIAALDLTGPTILDRDEPRFLLDLSDLVIPDGDSRIVPLRDAPESVRDWFVTYLVEALHIPQDEAEKRGRGDYDTNLPSDHFVVLMEGDQPLAMANLNARLPQIVQGGPVFTPPALRGRGYAKRVVALLLAKSRDEGVTTATLFTGSEAASRAYVAIGFRQVGYWTLLLR